MENVKYVYSLVQPIAFGMSFKSQSPWSLFNGTWQKRPRELDYRLKFDIEEMTLQMQSAVQPIAFGVSFNLNLQSQSLWSLQQNLAKET